MGGKANDSIPRSTLGTGGVDRGDPVDVADDAAFGGFTEVAGTGVTVTVTAVELSNVPACMRICAWGGTSVVGGCA